MRKQVLSADEFLEVHSSAAVTFDARSPLEFEKAHIPGALNLPLMDNEDRHDIGIVYKREGRQAAVIRGFERVGPRFHDLVRKGIELAGDNPVLVYCWRGGMRSNILAWLLRTAGLKVQLLDGGYKSYRRLMLEKLNVPPRMLVLGGKTGSGKTEMLMRLKDSGQTVLDLEGMASHKGSAFGSLGLPAQPSQEQFENRIGMELWSHGEQKPVWVENESRLIGERIVPTPFYEHMREAPVLEVVVDRSERKTRILREYGIFPSSDLAFHTKRISKRMGPQHVKAALEYLEQGDVSGWVDLVLDYYDKTYQHSREQRDSTNITEVPFSWENPDSGVVQLIAASDRIQFE